MARQCYRIGVSSTRAPRKAKSLLGVQARDGLQQKGDKTKPLNRIFIVFLAQCCMCERENGDKRQGAKSRCRMRRAMLVERVLCGRRRVDVVVMAGGLPDPTVMVPVICKERLGNAE